MPSIPSIDTRSMRSRWSLLVVVALALALASPTDAQVAPDRGNQQEMIPRDLVVALLSFGQPGNVDIRVAKVPESSSGSDGMTMHARLSARLKPAELVAHYDTQMKAAGWTPLADGAVDFLAARRYQKVDDQKRTWFGTLYAIMTPQVNEHDVTLHLTRR